MITPANILRHELTGLTLQVIKAQNKENLKIKGEVIAETRDTLTLKTKNQTKQITKSTVEVEANLPQNCKVQIAGKLLQGRSQDRIKKKIKIRY